MYKFFDGHGELPEQYIDSYLCLTLEIPYTELIKQPAWWVSDMVDLISKREKVKSDHYKAEEARIKRH